MEPSLVVTGLAVGAPETRAGSGLKRGSQGKYLYLSACRFSRAPHLGIDLDSSCAIGEFDPRLARPGKRQLRLLQVARLLGTSTLVPGLEVPRSPRCAHHVPPLQGPLESEMDEWRSDGGYLSAAGGSRVGGFWRQGRLVGPLGEPRSGRGGLYNPIRGLSRCVSVPHDLQSGPASPGQCPRYP